MVRVWLKSGAMIGSCGPSLGRSAELNQHGSLTLPQALFCGLLMVVFSKHAYGGKTCKAP